MQAVYMYMYSKTSNITHSLCGGRVHADHLLATAAHGRQAIAAPDHHVLVVGVARTQQAVHHALAAARTVSRASQALGRPLEVCGVPAWRGATRLCMRDSTLHGHLGLQLRLRFAGSTHGVQTEDCPLGLARRHSAQQRALGSGGCPRERFPLCHQAATSHASPSQEAGWQRSLPRLGLASFSQLVTGPAVWAAVSHH